MKKENLLNILNLFSIYILSLFLGFFGSALFLSFDDTTPEIFLFKAKIFFIAVLVATILKVISWVLKN